MRKFGLKGRLTLSLGALTFAAVTLVGILCYHAVSRNVYELTLRDLEHQLRTVDAAIQIAYSEDVDREKRIVARLKDRIVSHLQFDEQHPTRYRIENQLTNEKAEAEAATLTFDGKSLADHRLVDDLGAESAVAVTLFVRIPQGFLRASTTLRRKDGSRAVGTYIPAGAPVYEALSSGKPHYGRAMVLDEWYVTAYEPILHNGQVIGALFVGTRDTAFGKLRDYLKSQKLLQTGYFYMFDGNANMMLHPTLEGSNINELKDVDGNPIFRRMMEAKSGHLEYRWRNAETKEIQHKLAIFRHYPTVDWYVAASLNLAEARAEVVHLAWLLVWITIGVVTFCMAGASLAAHGITGKLTILVKRLGASSEAVTNESSLMAVTAQKMASASTQQAAAIQETVAATDELTAMVGQNEQSAYSAESLSEESRQAAQNGAQVISQLDQSISGLEQQNASTLKAISESYEQIREISNLIQTIEGKTRVIGDIVFQTKLLSFNASVEAARAGEHGKGFAVVAEEVGKLATLTGTSAMEIQQTVAQSLQQVETIIRLSTTRMNGTMTESEKQVQHCVNMSRQATEALTRILENIEKSHQSARLIAASSREQATGIAQIAQAMQEIDAATNENARLAQETDRQSKQMRIQSESLREIANRLAALSEGESVNQPKNKSGGSRPKLRLAA